MCQHTTRQTDRRTCTLPCKHRPCLHFHLLFPSQNPGRNLILSPSHCCITSSFLLSFFIGLGPRLCGESGRGLLAIKFNFQLRKNGYHLPRIDSSTSFFFPSNPRGSSLWLRGFIRAILSSQVCSCFATIKRRKNTSSSLFRSQSSKDQSIDSANHPSVLASNGFYQLTFVAANRNQKNHQRLTFRI